MNIGKLFDPVHVCGNSGYHSVGKLFIITLAL